MVGKQCCQWNSSLFNCDCGEQISTGENAHRGGTILRKTLREYLHDTCIFLYVS